MEVPLRLPALACFALLALPSGIRAQTFDFTFDQFRATLDGKIREDMADKVLADASTTRTCKKAKDVYTCTFNSAGFQAMVADFKRADMINGHFEQKLRLRAETESGKVSAIHVVGSRADPANIFSFLGTVLNVVQIFDPAATKVKPGDGTTSALVKELGLMRGDSAADIGKPVIAIKPYALIKCLTMPSRVSLDVGCVFEPRS